MLRDFLCFQTQFGWRYTKAKAHLFLRLSTCFSIGLVVYPFVYMFVYLYVVMHQEVALPQ